MTSPGKLASKLAIAAALASSSVALQAQPVADRVLSDARVTSVSTCSILTISFNVRVQMLSHFPQTGGRELHIRVKLLDALPNGRESLRTPSGIAALRSIEFEDNGSGDTSLSLFFKRDVAFDVNAGEQPQTLVIQISEKGSTAGCTDGTAELPRPAATTESVTPPSPGAVFKEPLPDGLYIVNLSSALKPIGQIPAPLAARLAGRVVYETRFEREAQTWFQLRVGFFASREKAEAFMKPFTKDYTEAWVTKVSAQEREQAVLSRLPVGPSQAPAVATPAQAAAPISDADRSAVAQLIADAETAITAGDQDRSVQLLTKALGYPENQQSARARELLGLTRERKGQLAQAKAEYEEYLRLYPSGEDSDRIRQRLASLGSSAATEAAPELRAARSQTRARTKDEWRWRARGSFSQFYMRDQSTVKSLDASKPVDDPDAKENDNNVNLNQLLTTTDISVSGGNDRNQILMRAAGSFTRNFRSGARDIKSINALYADFSDKRFNMSARIGRQTRNGYGILGRFDGAFVGWQFDPNLRFNVAAGFPVLTSRQTRILKDRFFYSLSADIGSKDDRIQTSLYWFDQRSHGLIDRRSVGTEIRYLDPKFNAYAVIDYDVKYGALNLGLLTLNYSFPDQSTFSLTADYRQSPLLTTTNALIGQPVLSLGDLRDLFDDATIYRLADDRTLVSKSVTASYSRPISNKLQANIDFSLTNTGGTPASGGVEAMPATGTEYFYGGQIVGSGMIWSNDIYIISLRYADTQRARTYTGDINARIPVTGKLRVNPRARYGIRDDKSGLSRFTQFQPTLRVNYYPVRHSEVELEFGGNFTRQSNTIAGSNFRVTESGYILTAGYRLDF